LCANQGQLHQSYELYHQAAQWIQETGEQHLGASSLIEIGIADVLCDRNDLGTAMMHAKKGLALLPLWGKADDLVLAYITMARIELAQSNRLGATEALEKACEIIQTTGVFPEAPRALELAQVKLWLAQGDIQAASCWAESLQERLNSGNPFRFENELAHIAQARVFIAQKQANEAIGLLSHLEEIARSSGRQGRLIEIMILKTLALQAVGDTPQANIALMKSLALAEPEGYMRIFLDEGEMMAKLLMQLSSTNLDSNREYVDRLLRVFAQKEKILA
jgi:LuxR family maltose regulon positive regulatory protein